MKVKVRQGVMHISLPVINPPRKSKSGKTLLIASSNGPRRTALKAHGKSAVVMATAYIRPDGYMKRADRRARKKLPTKRRVVQKHKGGERSTGSR
jgi:hypothetical protein